MALAFNPFDKTQLDARRNRAGRLNADFGATAGYGAGPDLYAPVMQSAPQSEPVTSMPNQINIDPSLAAPLMGDFQDYMAQRDRQGIGWLPMPTPYLSFHEQRDPASGDYVSRSFDADWSGVDPAVKAMQQMYLEPVVGRLNRSIPDENRIRQQTREATEFKTYKQPRLKQVLGPDGRMTYSIVEDELTQPFFDPAAMYGALR